MVESSLAGFLHRSPGRQHLYEPLTFPPHKWTTIVSSAHWWGAGELIDWEASSPRAFVTVTLLLLLRAGRSISPKHKCSAAEALAAATTTLSLNIYNEIGKGTSLLPIASTVSETVVGRGEGCTGEVQQLAWNQILMRVMKTLCRGSEKQRHLSWQRAAVGGTFAIKGYVCLYVCLRPETSKATGISVIDSFGVVFQLEEWWGFFRGRTSPSSLKRIVGLRRIPQNR